MTLRNRLLLAQGPLVAALLVAAFAGSAVVVALGKSGQRILKENYRSVLAAQRMNEAIERLDQAALFRVAGRPELIGESEERARKLFEEELRVEEANITEPGEAEATAKLRGAWEAYKTRFEWLAAVSPEFAGARYFEKWSFKDDPVELLPQFFEVKRATQAILDLNQDAMVRKSDRADQEARRLRAVMVAVALGGCLLGFLATSALTARLLRPLRVLAQAARRIGQGDLKARAIVQGGDEVAQLAAEFNAMTDQLQQYRESSIGELFEAQQASQATIDSLPDPVIVVDPEGHLLHRNDAAGSILGIQLGIASPLAVIDPQVREAIERARDHVLGGKGAYSPRGLDGALQVRNLEGERYLLVRATPVYSGGGSIDAVTIVLQDVTRLRRFDELASDLIATAAHEFRTPLTSLRMAIHLCLEGVPGPLNDAQADLLQAAREDCERLQTLVDELLDLSRMQGGRLVLRRSRIEAETLVRQVVADHQSAALERNVELSAVALPDAGQVDADGERLSIVIGNLVGNAIHHAPAGSRVVVRARTEANSVRFEVTDQGPGIPPEHHEAIFEKHFRLPGEPGVQGAGLGLYIAREIVHAHGGAIGVEIAVGKGSTFWFTLPAAASGAPA